MKVFIETLKPLNHLSYFPCVEFIFINSNWTFIALNLPKQEDSKAQVTKCVYNWVFLESQIRCLKYFHKIGIV